ncbi:MAG: hypothetical protein KME23_05315 [Goleter apudmare HA4340-LM2]|jgi:hypothetical protein|nr:hypothetical protein [Goleter apudmare HA4340-LM2]
MDAKALEFLKHRIVGHPRNESLLQFVDVTPDNDWQLQTWRQADCGFDEGGQIFFDNYGQHLPENTKYTLLIHNLMVNPENGLIFGAHYSRCTFFIRCDFNKCRVANSDALRRGETLDGRIDIECLGSEWALLSCFVEQESENFEWAYLLTQRNET